MGLAEVPAEIREVWLAALAHSGVDPADAVLYAFDGAISETGYHAKAWRRGDTVNEPGDVAAFGDDIGRANTETERERRRVAIWIDQPSEIIAGLLRHELEHTLQFDADPDHELDDLYYEALVALNQAATDVPRNEAGEVIGGGELYNQIPMEADANAAAASFARSHFGDQRIDRLLTAGTEHDLLFRASTSPDRSTIHQRMRQFVLDGAAEAVRAFTTRVQTSLGT